MRPRRSVSYFLRDRSPGFVLCACGCGNSLPIGTHVWRWRERDGSTAYASMGCVFLERAIEPAPVG